jgi:IS5 family transposase
MALGAMVIEEKQRLSDEETVEQNRENPYLQHFLGLKQYEDKAVSHPTMFVRFRKRLPEGIIIRTHDLIA